MEITYREKLSDMVISEPMPWTKEALCKTSSINMDTFFFDEHGLKQIKLAKAICSACPVQEECLDFAVRNLEIGIWGGTTTKERKKMRANHLKETRIHKGLKRITESFGKPQKTATPKKTST